jgi:hypothetical protein
MRARKRLCNKGREKACTSSKIQNPTGGVTLARNEVENGTIEVVKAGN